MDQIKLINHESTNLSEPISAQKNNISDLVTAKIRKAIIVGDLAPGERLIETALAEQLGISRVPIREALQHLEDEGIIIKSKVRGYEVWSPTKNDMDEIVSLRHALDSIAYQTIAANMQPQDYEFLERLMDQCKIVFDNKEFEALVIGDRQFHEYLVMKSGQMRIYNFMRTIMTQWQILLYRGATLDVPYSSDIYANLHKDLLRSIRSGDLQEAERLLDIHYEYSHTELKQSMKLL